MMSLKRDPCQDSDKHGQFLQQCCMKTNSLQSVLLTLFMFFGVFQFQNLKKNTPLKYKDLRRIEAERKMRGLLNIAS